MATNNAAATATALTPTEIQNETKHFFFDENLPIALTTGLRETLHEMCRLRCDFDNNFIAQQWLPVGQASGSVELISQEQRGQLQLHFSDVAILTIMAKLLGRTPIQVNEEALDCARALTGIVYGRMKAILNPLGHKFKMVIPQVNYTDKLSHPEGDVRHLIIPFRVAGSKCFVQVIFYA